MGSKKGYTFIELMVVLALVGLASSIALSSHLAQKPRAQLRQASREILSQLRGIRQQSITTGQVTTICFSDDDDLLQINGDNIAVADNEYVIIPGRTKKTLPSKIRFGYPDDVTETPRGGALSVASQDGITFNPCVSFQPNGTANSLNGQIYLTNASDNPEDNLQHESFAIDINVTGQVRLYRWKNTQWQ
ncbi:MAG: prepilin-type N-terminal cleavage/methylation domain-containing protein [Nitrospirae bacterium]|nr:prepilin-type N-terminal cleavage/methylation domain-containing protein [Candidatus Manganitrophaceae bacterium]